MTNILSVRVQLGVGVTTPVVGGFLVLRSTRTSEAASHAASPPPLATTAANVGAVPPLPVACASADWSPKVLPPLLKPGSTTQTPYPPDRLGQGNRWRLIDNVACEDPAAWRVRDSRPPQSATA
jgi:hypothetical protein